MAVGKVDVNNPNLQIMFYNAFKAFFKKIPELNVSIKVMNIFKALQCFYSKSREHFLHLFYSAQSKTILILVDDSRSKLADL